MAYPTMMRSVRPPMGVARRKTIFRFMPVSMNRSSSSPTTGTASFAIPKVSSWPSVLWCYAHISAGRVNPLRWMGEQHVREDLGRSRP
jgi:hypothetical protein